MPTLSICGTPGRLRPFDHGRKVCGEVRVGEVRVGVDPMEPWGKVEGGRKNAEGRMQKAEGRMRRAEGGRGAFCSMFDKSWGFGRLPAHVAFTTFCHSYSRK